MNYVPLSEVTDNIGRSPPRNRDKSTNLAVKVVGSGLHARRPASYSKPARRTNLATVPNDVLLPKLQSNNKIVYVDDTSVEAFSSTEFFNLRSKSNRLDSRYLFWFLKSRFFEFEKNRRCTGSVISTLPLSELGQIKIPLPANIAEQRRIAGVLNKANFIQQKCQEMHELVDVFINSVFLELFFESQSRWPKKPIEAIAELIPGHHYRTDYDSSDTQANEIIFLKPKNISNSRLNFDQVSFISKDAFASFKHGKLQRGDLIFALQGRTGQCAIFDNMVYETGTINRQIMIIRPNNCVSANYLHRLIVHPTTQNRLLGTQTKPGVSRLTAKQIGAVEIPIPSIEIQRNYDKIVSRAEQTYQDLKLAHAYADGLCSSISQQFFNKPIER